MITLVAACGEGAPPRPPAIDAAPAKAVDAAGVLDADGARKKNFAADKLVREGRHAEAIALYEEVVRAQPTWAQAWANLGWTRFLAGDRAGAAEANERALALALDDPAVAGAAEYNLGRVAEARGDLAEAKRRYRASLTVRPHAGVAARLSGLLSDEERDEDADLLEAASPPPPDRKVVSASSVAEAVKACSASAVPLVTAGETFALARSGDRLVAVAHVGKGRWGTQVLGEAPSAPPEVEEVELDGRAPPERIVRGDAGTWLLGTTPDGVRVLLHVARGYSLAFEPNGTTTDVVVTARSGTPPDPEGPEGRWRLVAGTYKRLVL